VHSKHFNLISLTAGILTSIIVIAVVYLLVLLFSYGGLIISGKYFSLLILNIGLFGFTILVVLNSFNVAFSRLIDIIIVIICNCIYSYYSMFNTPIVSIGGLADDAEVAGHNVAIRLLF